MMSMDPGDLHCCAAAYYPANKADHHTRFLTKTAAAFGIKMNYFGIGEKWTHFVGGKLIGLRKHLEDVKEPYVLAVDANDSVFVRDGEALANAYNTVGPGRIVMQGVGSCFPHMLLKKKFPHPKGKYEWPYLCAGLLIGPRDLVCEAIDKMMEMRAKAPSWMPGRNDDQGWWSIAAVERWADIVIDRQSRVSLCMFNSKLAWYDHGDMTYGPQGINTCILHFAGQRRPGAFWAFLKQHGIYK
jgi:hypothetical protein